MSAGLGWPAASGAPLQTQGNDWQINEKPTPGYMVSPTEAGGLYGGMREVAGNFWTLQNADYLGGQWQLINPALPAWAFVLLSGGGFAMYTAPANSSPGFAWTPIWEVSPSGSVIIGNGGPASIQYGTNYAAHTLYNFGTYQGAPPGTATANTTALGNLFTAMANGQSGGGSGGFAWIPQFSYPVNSAVTPGALVVPDQCIIEGLGMGGHGQSLPKFTHFEIFGSGSGFTTGNVFLNLSGAHTSGGVWMRGLSFDWSASTNQSDMCLFLGIWNGHIERCNFNNCPVVAGFGQLPNGGSHSPGGLSCSLEQCTIQYGLTMNNVTQIWFTGEQAQLLGPSEYTQVTGVGSGGPTQCVCISIGGGVPGSEHQMIQGIHLSDWSYCIDFADINNVGIGSGCQQPHIIDCECDGFITAINLSTYTSAGQIYGAKFIGGTYAKGTLSNDGHPIFLIDTNGGANSNVDNIDLIGATIFSLVASNVPNGGSAQNNQYGLQINGGQSIRVIGGKICNVGSNANPNNGSANIAITSSYTFPYNAPNTSSIGQFLGSPNTSTTTGPTAVQIIGVNLAASYPFMSGNGTNGSGPSQYALLVTGTQAGTILVDSCMMLGFGGNPVSVTANVTGELFIRNCPGYNDQSTSVFGTNMPTSAPTASGAGSNAATAASLGGNAINYYGPSIVQFLVGSAGVTMTLKGVATALPANQYVCITLISPYDHIFFSNNTSTHLASFSWIGL